MPDFIDAVVKEFLRDPAGWSGVVVAILLPILAAAVGPIRRAIVAGAKAAVRWLRSWRLTREPKRPADLPWVAPPQFTIRMKTKEGRRLYGIVNSGGTAKNVRLWADEDDVVLFGPLAWPELAQAGIGPFMVEQLHADGIFDTWLSVASSDANDVPQPIQRVRIPGISTF